MMGWDLEVEQEKWRWGGLVTGVITSAMTLQVRACVRLTPLPLERTQVQAGFYSYHVCIVSKQEG